MILIGLCEKPINLHVVEKAVIYNCRHFSTTVCTVQVCMLGPLLSPQQLITLQCAKGISCTMPQIQSHSAADFCALQ